MIEYLVVNTVFSLLVVALLRVLHRAPANLRHWLAMTGLLCWLVPWPLFEIPLPNWLAAKESNPVFYQFVVFAGESQANLSQSWFSETQSWLAVIGFILAVGACLFIRDIMLHLRELRQLSTASQSGEDLLSGFGVKPQSQVASSKARVL